MATVLVVDDDRDLREIVEMVLHMEGYHVVAAASGEEAMELLLGGSIDLVLTDNHLGARRMSGIELVRQIKLLPNQPGVLVMTGSDEHIYGFPALNPSNY